MMISYAGEDRFSHVAPLLIFLRSMGIPVWYDEISIAQTLSRDNELFGGIVGSAMMLSIATSNYLSKKWPQLELVTAIRHGVTVLPVFAQENLPVGWLYDFEGSGDEFEQEMDRPIRGTVGKLLESIAGVSNRGRGWSAIVVDILRRL